MVHTIYRERRENRSLADMGYILLSVVCIGYAMLLIAYLIMFATTPPSESHPLSWWIAILGVNIFTLAGFFLLARYLHRLSGSEIPFEAQGGWMLLLAAMCMGIRCAIDFFTHASGAQHALNGPFAFFLDGSADRFLCLTGMVVFSFWLASMLNYCGMLQADICTID